MSFGIHYIEWICTDRDNKQYRLDEGQDLWRDTKYTFKERGYKLTIDLKEYSPNEILNIISSYGYSGNGIDWWVDGTDEEISNDIIAECIFEQESGLY